MSFSTLQIDDRLAWGGGQSQVLHLLKGLKEASHHAELVTRPGSALGKCAADIGIKVHEAPMRGDVDLFSALRIAKIVRSGGFDIVHMHASHPHALGLMALTLNRAPKRVVSRMVVFPIKQGPLGLGRLKYLMKVDGYIAVCGAAKDVLIEVGVEASKVRIVHSGALAPRMIEGKSVRAEFGMGPDTKLVGTVGELVEAKGQRHLIEAVPIILKKIPSARFMIVGGGELESELRAQAFRLGFAEFFVFTGFRKDVGNCLDAFDLFVLPSIMEGLNNSIVEAMMMEKPVVGTNVGGIPEIVKHGETGLLVPPGDPASLAEAVVELLENPEKAHTLASAGRDFAMNNLTAKKMVEGTIAVYEDILKD
jgi:glycosyltransferase involved in cell wall biosynthesis